MHDTVDHIFEELKRIMAVTDNRVIGQVIKSKDNLHIYNWLLSKTSQLSETATVKERIHIVLTGDNPICQYGQSRRYYASESQYKFCNTIDKCQCYREHYNRNHVPLDKETTDLICEKRKITWLNKYGVDNPSKNTSIVDKRKETMLGRTYDRLQAKLKHQDLGYNQVIDRVKDYVTPAFSREEYQGCFRKNFYKWNCNNCGSEVLDHVDYGRIPRCLKCNPKIVSKNEIALRDYVASLGFAVIANDKDTLKDREYDILIPEKKVAIEFNGIYWHSSKYKDRYYHVDKFIKSRELGIRLIQVWEDEWINKSDIVKSRLQALLGISPKIAGRRCVVKAVDLEEYRKFCEQHHLKGYAAATIRYGLYHNDTLVAVMGFGKSRYTKDGYELIRYCSAGIVVGGASKLFAAFKKEYLPFYIISYADRCWSDGGLYRKLGFVDVTANDRNIGYWYIKQNVRYHRSTFTKSRLVQMGYDPNLTEQQIMEQAGYHKIYDCGNYKFEWQSESGEKCQQSN